MSTASPNKYLVISMINCLFTDFIMKCGRFRVAKTNVKNKT